MRGGERNTQRPSEAALLKREESWALEERTPRVLEGSRRGDGGYWRRLRRQECIGAFSVNSNAGGGATEVYMGGGIGHGQCEQ